MKGNLIVVLRGDVMPKFSIVIPVYNVEEYIGRCLESVKNQTFKDYEVIVVNDGCTDKSIEVAKQYDVKIIKTEHVSVSEARNIGVKHAKGEYLIFLDRESEVSFYIKHEGV